MFWYFIITLFSVALLYKFFKRNNKSSWTEHQIHDLFHEQLLGTKIREGHEKEFESTRIYLQRRDVSKQISEILNKIDASEFKHKLQYQLGIIFMELEAITPNGMYILNLYPCSKCACVGWEKENMNK